MVKDDGLKGRVIGKGQNKFLKFKGRKKIPMSKAFWRMPYWKRKLARDNNYKTEFMPKERKKRRK